MANGRQLPPGFRFDPSDEDLIVHFLQRKASSLLPCHPDIIPDLDLYPYDPWELDAKALAEGQQWYFYSRRAQNRVTSSGNWTPIGIEEPVVTSGTKKRVGFKKYLVFYDGEGNKTDWIMEEYRLSDGASSSSSSSSSRTSSKSRSSRPKLDNKWVVCRVYERNCDNDDDDDDDGKELSCLDEVFLSLDDFDEISLPNHFD